MFKSKRKAKEQTSVNTEPAEPAAISEAAPEAVAEVAPPKNPAMRLG